jgi:hypothetical protein
MYATNEVKEFLEKLKKQTIFDGASLVQVITDDEQTIRREVTNGIFGRRVHVDGTWSHYLLSDVDVIYDEDMLEFISRMDMVGIRKDIPPVRAEDTAIAIIYKFVLFDAYGGELNSINAFRIILQQENGIVRNRRIVMYG